MTEHWPAIFPQIILATGGILVYAVGGFLPRYRNLPFFIGLFSIFGCGLAAALTGPQSGTFAFLIDVGSFSRFYLVLLSLVTLLALLMLHQYAQRRGFDNDILYGTLLFGALGMITVAGAGHWLVFFLGLELLSISLYIIIAIRRDQDISYEAAIKYFIMGSVASSFLVFGIALLYADTGTLAIGASLTQAGASGNPPLAVAGLGMILVGVGFKISLVPFHLWTPDVYEGAPAPITAFLATGTKIALFAFLLRLTRGDGVTGSLLAVFWSLAALTMVVGNLTALVQNRLKRLLAYSSVAHMGYLLMALLAGGDYGVAAVIFYSTVYGFMDLTVFTALGLMSEEKEDLNRLEDCRGLGYSHPFAAGLFALGLLALAGLPPTGGLIGKFLIFTAAFQAGFIYLAMIGIITAMVSVYFYFKVVVILYMQPAQAVGSMQTTGVTAVLAGVILILGLLWLGLVPQGLLIMIDGVVATLP